MTDTIHDEGEAVRQALAMNDAGYALKIKPRDVEGLLAAYDTLSRQLSEAKADLAEAQGVIERQRKDVRKTILNWIMKDAPLAAQMSLMPQHVDQLEAKLVALSTPPRPQGDKT